MLIDWFTVIAQIVNFLILVGLLKYFLYGRILRAMDQREDRIASRLTEAEQREQEAEDERRHYQARQKDLEEKQSDILAEAREKAEAERKRLLDEARARGQTRMNLGLGVNEGISRFKQKWGGLPYLPYEFCECYYGRSPTLALLDDLLAGSR